MDLILVVTVLTVQQWLDQRAVPLHQESVVKYLRTVTDRDSIRAFRRLIRGTLEEKIAAVDFFGNNKNSLAIPLLIQCLSDESACLRAHSAWALGEIGDKAAIRPLIIAAELDEVLSSKQVLRTTNN